MAASKHPKPLNIDLESMDHATLLGLQNSIVTEIKRRWRVRASQFAGQETQTFNVLWYPDSAYYHAELISVDAENGLLEVRFLENENDSTFLVSPDCILGRVDLTKMSKSSNDQ